MRRTFRMTVFALAFLLPILLACGQRATQAGEQEKQETTMGQKIDDATITTRIKTVYLFNPHLNSFKINVTTENGVVTLDGVVKTGIQKDLAGEIARNPKGVDKVRNQLQVSEGAVREPDEVDRTFSQAVIDATTTATVKTALAFTKGVKASDVNVDTRWGTVTLTGSVATKAERELAETTARNSDGVKEVDNQIQVRS